MYLEEIAVVCRCPELLVFGSATTEIRSCPEYLNVVQISGLVWDTLFLTQVPLSPDRGDF